MPVIAVFYGIIIRMFTRKSEHNPPHFHAEYQGHKGIFSLDGHMTTGDIPPKQQKYIEVWADIHHEELLRNWENEGAQPGKIEPLK